MYVFYVLIEITKLLSREFTPNNIPIKVLRVLVSQNSTSIGYQTLIVANQRNWNWCILFWFPFITNKVEILLKCSLALCSFFVHTHSLYFLLGCSSFSIAVTRICITNIYWAKYYIAWVIYSTNCVTMNT